MQTVSLLYARYKRYNDIVDSLEEPLPICSTDMDTLYNHMSKLMKEYVIIYKCIEGRILFRDKYVPKDQQDEGHEFMIKKLQEKLLKYDYVLGEMYKTIENILSKEDTPSTPEIEQVVEESVSTAVQPKKKVKEIDWLSKLIENDFNTHILPKDIDYKQLYQCKNHVKKLIDSENIKELILQCMRNKYILSFVIPYACKRKKSSIIQGLVNYVEYIHCKENTDDFKNYVNDSLLDYTVQVNDYNLFWAMCHIFWANGWCNTLTFTGNDFKVHKYSLLDMMRSKRHEIAVLLAHVIVNDVPTPVPHEMILKIAKSVWKEYKRCPPRNIDVLRILLRGPETIHIVSSFLDTLDISYCHIASIGMVEYLTAVDKDPEKVDIPKILEVYNKAKVALKGKTPVKKCIYECVTEIQEHCEKYFDYYYERKTEELLKDQPDSVKSLTTEEVSKLLNQ